VRLCYYIIESDTRLDYVWYFAPWRHQNQYKLKSNSLAHLAEEQFIKDGVTWNKDISRSFRVGTRRLIMYMEGGEDLDPLPPSQPQERRTSNKNCLRWCQLRQVYDDYDD